MHFAQFSVFNSLIFHPFLDNYEKKVNLYIWNIHILHFPSIVQEIFSPYPNLYQKNLLKSRLLNFISCLGLTQSLIFINFLSCCIWLLPSITTFVFPWSGSHRKNDSTLRKFGKEMFEWNLWFLTDSVATRKKKL